MESVLSNFGASPRIRGYNGDLGAGCLQSQGPRQPVSYEKEVRVNNESDASTLILSPPKFGSHHKLWISRSRQRLRLMLHFGCR
jgi:hypothetical protein